MPVVRIPTVLRKHTGGLAKVRAQGSTVGEALTAVVNEHPSLRDQLFDGGTIRGFVNVYVDDEDIRYLGGLETPVEDATEVAIMPAVAGGTRSAG